MVDQPNKGEGTWTDERVTQLCRSLWDNPRLVAREIAADLGVTRSAVIAKLRRMQAKGMDVPKLIWGPAGPPVDKPRKARVRKPAQPRMAPRPRPAPPPRPLPDLVGRYTLLELEPHHCRWPFGEERFTFCGELIQPGQPYCLAHCRIAYNRPY